MLFTVICYPKKHFVEVINVINLSLLVEQLEKDTKDKGLELGLITFHQRILYWHSSGHSSSRAVGWEKAQNNSKS